MYNLQLVKEEPLNREVAKIVINVYYHCGTYFFVSRSVFAKEFISYQNLEKMY